MSALDERISEWRAHVLRREAILAEDVDELEDHLRSQVTELEGAGLSEDEAFLIAVKRMGSLDSISHEFAQEYSERLWKRLVVPRSAGENGSLVSREVMVALGFAVAAGASIKAPELFGIRIAVDVLVPAAAQHEAGGDGTLAQDLAGDRIGPAGADALEER